jgi:TonB family protein
VNTDRTPDPSNDLNLLREWREPIPPSRIVLAIAGAIVYHLAALSVVITAINAPLPERIPDFVVDVRKAIPLYIPQDLTQRDPNRGKITRDLDVRSSAPPAPVPQAPHFRAPIPAPAAAPSIPAPIEPPKIEAEAAPPPPVASPGILPPIAPPPPEKPKLAFEPVGSGGTSPRPNYNPNAKLPPIANTVEDTLRPAIPPAPAQPSAGVTIGDIDEFTNIPSQNQAPSNGPARSNLQLLSDPAGVDFKPYLVQVLAAVRTNWLSVIPESARSGGRKGRVLIQFIIDRRGGVPKLVIAEPSGTAAFDRAAVAGISASYPFPPLPKTFKGNEIRLQLAFTYNQPR